MDKPKQFKITQEEIDAIIKRMNNNELSAEDKDLIKGVFEFSVWLDRALSKTKLTITKLKKMLGFKTEKFSTKKNKENTENLAITSNEDNEKSNINDKTKEVNNLDKNNSRPNHNGKNGQDDYKSAEREFILLEEKYHPGMLCLCCKKGKMYKANAGVVLRLYGSPMVKAVIYELETLRCNLCGAAVKANLPLEAKEGKHSYSLIAQIALQKLLIGVPYHAQADYHKYLETPLPASTQWMLVKTLHETAIYIFNTLVYMAAQSWLCTLDDTKCRILSVIKDNKDKKQGERTGTYTTGLLFDYHGKQIALYISGRQYAGENLSDTLEQRESKLEPMHVMADGSANNNPESLNLDIIMHNCLTHARRQFYDLDEYYEEESLAVIDFLEKVYKNDKYAKENKLSDDERLKHHQKHSAPIMESLKVYLKKLLLDKRKCEPNGDLTRCINYILSRWEKITRFLKISGAPLDSNAVERLLKTIIRIRKTAMFFKTESSAAISSTILSVIKTCIENKENPLKYLIDIQKYSTKVIEEPKNWMPWNYKQTILKIAEKPELIDTR